ncbi:4-hydroxybenzoate polyprenyltransferase, mitochondrial [Diutina rugosa]
MLLLVRSPWRLAAAHARLPINQWRSLTTTIPRFQTLPSSTEKVASTVVNEPPKLTPEQVNPKLHVASDPKRAAQVSLARSKFTAEELEASRLARLARLGWVGKLPEKWIPYAELMRLEKPVGTLLLLLPCYWGITMAAYSIAAPFMVAFKAITLFSIGALIMRGAGCTINDIWDRELDNQVSRTLERPIASGRVSVPQATAWMVAQGLAGLVVLLALPPACFWVGCWSLPFIAAYPLFKRFTYYPQYMLSICFSWGILMGYPAVGAPIDWAVVLPMFAANWIWCVVYDTVYAHQDKKFDIHAGIKSTALAWGDRTKPILNGLTTAQVGLYTLSGFMNSMGPGFYAGAAWGFYRIYTMIKKVDLDDEASCWKGFTGNIKTGIIFWLGIVVDYLLLLAGVL